MIGHLGRSRRTIENYVYGPDFPLYVGNSLEEGFSPPSPKGKRSGGIKIELNNRPENNALGVRRRELPQKKGGENNHANAMPVRDQRSEVRDIKVLRSRSKAQSVLRNGLSFYE